MAGVDAFLNKKYKLHSSENFDEIMKALGVGLLVRKMGNTVSPVIELTKNGDEYTLSSASTFKNHVMKFKPGVEFEMETPDGRKAKSVITVDGNVMDEVQTDTNGKVTNVKREFGDQEIKIVTVVDNIECNRIYKLQA